MRLASSFLLIPFGVALVGCGEQRAETGYDSGPSIVGVQNVMAEPPVMVERVAGTSANGFTATSAEGTKFTLKYVSRKLDGKPASWDVQQNRADTAKESAADALRFDAVLTVLTEVRARMLHDLTVWPLNERGERITLNGAQPGFGFSPVVTQMRRSGEPGELSWTLPVTVAHIREDGTASFEIDLKGQSTDVIEEVDISGFLKSSTYFKNLETSTTKTGELRDFVISYDEDRRSMTSENIVVAVARDPKSGKVSRHKPYQTKNESGRTTSFFRAMEGEFEGVALERKKPLTIRFDGVPMAPRGVSVDPTKVKVIRALAAQNAPKAGAPASVATGFSGVTQKGTTFNLSTIELLDKAWTPDGVLVAGYGVPAEIYAGRVKTQFEVSFSNAEENLMVVRCVATDPKTGKELDLDFRPGASSFIEESGVGRRYLEVGLPLSEPVDLAIYLRGDVLKVKGVHLRPLRINKSLTSR